MLDFSRQLADMDIPMSDDSVGVEKLGNDSVNKDDEMFDDDPVALPSQFSVASSRKKSIPSSHPRKNAR